MSILDQIYAGAKSVQTELKGMNAALKTMQQQDKAEYKLDAKDRKYERERDKREAQDRKDLNKKLFDEVDKQSNSLHKEEEGKKLASGLASATAAAIAEQVKKNKKEQKGVEGEGGPGFTQGLDGPTPQERRQVLSSSPITPVSGTPTMAGQAVPIQDTSTEGRLAALEETVFSSMTPAPVQKFQSGGFAGAVPNLGQPGTGDHFYTHVAPGSYVLNRNAVAAMGFQGGGNVPVALEQGEIVIPPGQYDQKVMDFINYAAAPRFQQGGAVQDAQEVGDDGEKLTVTVPDPKVNLDQIQPGGKLSFIGDGSGFTGGLKLIDGGGKEVAQYIAASGIPSTAKSSQEDRKNVSGTKNPIPDGNFPLMGLTMHPGEAIGDWSDYVNNNAGSIGARGQILVHPDLGQDGTSGCVGVQLGGSRGTKQEKKFLEIYEKLQPKRIIVDLDVKGVGGESALGVNPESAGDPGSSSTTAPEKQEKGIFSGPFGGFLKALDQQIFGGGKNKFGLSLSMILDPASAFGDLVELGADMLMPGAEAKTLEDSPADQLAPTNTDTAVQYGKWGPVLELIAKYEAGPHKWEGMYPSTRLAGATKMTIAEVAKKATGAVGMYQNLPRYLNERARAVGLDPNKDLYNKENQIKIAEYLIGPGQANVTVAMAKNNPKKAMHQLSKVWAAIPKDDGGRSYYAGDGVNKAHIKPAQMYAAFKKLQKGGSVDMLSKVLGTDLSEFFKQSDMQLAQMAVSDMEPTVINIGGEEEPDPQVTAHTLGSNLPNYNLPTRDFCPLSVYYRYHPSLNPQGMNP